jgi:hypothetical protein
MSGSCCFHPGVRDISKMLWSVALIIVMQGPYSYLRDIAQHGDEVKSEDICHYCMSICMKPPIYRRGELLQIV